LRPPPAQLFAFIATLVLLAGPTASGQALSGPETTPEDSTTVAPDSSVADSVSIFLPPLLVSAMSQTVDSISAIEEDDIPWMGVRAPGGLTGLSQGIYLRDPNVDGQYVQVNARGVDWRGVAFTADGRTLNDPATGIFNPSYFPSDFIERVEIIPGPRSFLYGLNGAGATVNFVTKHHDTFTPISRLNYFEGSHGSGYLDASIAQNISERMSAMVGLQRRITDGRFENSAYEAWNSRIRLRYRLGDRSALIFTHMLTSTKTQLNGGIAPDPLSLSNAFFPLSTTVRNEDSYEKLDRNDLDLAFVGYFLDEDASPTRLSFYYSNNFREYRDEQGGTPPNDVFIQSDHTSSWMGALFSQRIDQEIHRFTLSSNIEIRQIEGSPNLGRRRNVIGSVNAIEELFPGEFVEIAGYGRYDRYLNDDFFGFGADARLNLFDGFSLFGGGSFSQRLPNYQELYWADSTVSRTGTIQQEEHRHVELGVEISSPGFLSLRAAYFQRRVVHPILYLPFGSDFVFTGADISNGADVINQGIDFRFWVRVWYVYIEGNGLFLTRTSESPITREYPEFSGNWGIYYWEHLVHDHLHLKVGFRGSFQTGQTGTSFNPEMLAYIQNPDAPLSTGGGVDFLLVAHIGDAHVHFIWENIIEAEYFATPYYPVRDRAIRIGIAWTFLD